MSLNYKSLLNSNALSIDSADMSITGLTTDAIIYNNTSNQLASATVTAPVEFKSGALSINPAGLITASYPLNYASPTLSLLYNTNNLKLTSNELNTIQNISTASAPTFAGLTLNGQLTYLNLPNSDDSILYTSSRSTFPSHLHSCIFGYAGSSITSGTRNILFGNEVGLGILNGSYNVLMGDNLGNSIVSGSFNCLIGCNSGNISDISNAIQMGVSSCSGSDCITLGTQANDQTTGSGNISIGSAAGNSNTSGIDNVFIGNSCGTGISTGIQSYNTAIGHAALRDIIDGLRNTAIGDSAGYNCASGTDNVFLGYYAGYSETGSNKLYISNSNTATPLIYGDFASSILTINNNLKISGLTASRLTYSDTNKQLASLSSGTTSQYLRGDLTWQSLSGSFEPPISAGTTAQYWRGDKTWQTLNQAAVAGLTTSSSPQFTNLGLNIASLSYMGIRMGGTLSGSASVNTYGILLGNNMTVTTAGYGAFGLSMGFNNFDIPVSGGYNVFGIDINGSSMTKTGGTVTYAMGARLLMPNVSASYAVGMGCDSLCVSSNGLPWTDRTTATGQAYISSCTGIGVLPASDRLFYTKNTTQTYNSFLNCQPTSSSGSSNWYGDYIYTNTVGLTSTASATLYGLYVNPVTASTSNCAASYGGYYNNMNGSTTAANNYALYAADLVVGSNAAPGSLKPTNGIYCSGNVVLNSLTASSLVATDSNKQLTSTTSGLSPTFSNLTINGTFSASSGVTVSPNISNAGDTKGVVLNGLNTISNTTGTGYHVYQQAGFSCPSSSTSTVHGMYLDAPLSFGAGVPPTIYTLTVKKSGSGTTKAAINTDDIIINGGSVLSTYKTGSESISVTYNNGGGSTTLTVTYTIIGKICTINIPTFTFTGNNTGGIVLTTTSKNIVASVSSVVPAITLQGGAFTSGLATISTSQIIFFASGGAGYNGASSGFHSSGCSITYPI